MKKNQSSLLLAVIVTSAMLFCQNIKAQIVLPNCVDPFNYKVSNLLGEDAPSGGTGLIPGWNGPQGQITITNGSGSLDGTHLGLQASTGDKVQIAGITNGVSSAANPFNGCDNKFDAAGTYRPTANPPTNCVYYSFLYEPLVGTDVPSTGQMIFCANRENSGITSPLTFHWRLIAKNVGGSNIQLGISKQIDASSPQVNQQTNYATTNLVPGQTYLIVIRSAITNTTPATPETETLWIDPPTNTMGLGEGSVPPYSASTTNGSDDSSTTGQGRFWIVDSGVAANFDELRIAPNWALATPAWGSCFPAVVTTDLTNKTQSAEISVTMSTLDGLATAPAYQWQRTNSGAGTFTNIPGATASTYTTPNLQLPGDNGAQYRCISTVACDTTSATTSVATVTLTTPTPTANGTIVDDTFVDGFRGNTPVSSVNSVWYTAVTSDLYVDGTPQLVGIPISGTSSLWLGYFVTTNVPPLDLAIGQELRITLTNFMTGNFNDGFTNNGALRFGLFDYADGGTVVTVDSTTAPTAVTGSTGNGQNVRGYMLSVDFGTNFSSGTPLSLLVRDALSDVNLMGTTDDYLSMKSGPAYGGYSNAPAFQPNTAYTLVMSVTRLTTNGCGVYASITGGGTNWAWASPETNNYGYHRFDSFAIRDNELENFCDQMDIPEFKVEVLNAPTLHASSIIMGTNAVSSGATNVVFNWTPSPVGTYIYSVYSKTNLTDPTWTTNVTGYIGTSYIDSTITGQPHRFYRVSSP